jgi:hypothetical protein
MKRIIKKVFLEIYEEGITHIFLDEKNNKVEHSCLFKFEENGIIFMIGLDKDLKISEIEIDTSALPPSFVTDK